MNTKAGENLNNPKQQNVSFSSSLNPCSFPFPFSTHTRANKSWQACMDDNNTPSLISLSFVNSTKQWKTPIFSHFPIYPIPSSLFSAPSNAILLFLLFYKDRQNIENLPTKRHLNLDIYFFIVYNRNNSEISCKRNTKHSLLHEGTSILTTTIT